MQGWEESEKESGHSRSLARTAEAAALSLQTGLNVTTYRLMDGKGQKGRSGAPPPAPLAPPGINDSWHRLHGSFQQPSSIPLTYILAFGY